MDKINPHHYKQYSIEVIEMMRKIYGDEKVVVYCELSAFKYRMRIGNKPGENPEDDFHKEQWYLNKIKELYKKEE